MIQLQQFLHNDIVVYSAIGALIAVLGLILTKAKLAKWGLSASQFLNKKIGVKATQWLENKLQEFLNGMEQDNLPNENTKDNAEQGK